MPLTVGSALGPYIVEAPLGAGGMGEVYRARDTRLSRTVAIKVLSARLSEDAGFRRRFEREARAIAGLEHPHICPLYDVGDHDGTSFLVMQHLQGETLASHLQRGPLPVDRAIQFGVEIARALDAAHRAGVVHRDLKPANVMITKGGVKLLDFGLARVAGGDGPAETDDRDTTVASALTGDGTLMGTVPYMAPEQLEGRTADGRTDIFALGVVLFEMTTGKRPFDGPSQASLMAAIMSVEPPVMSASRAGVPPSFDRVVKKCLAKDPDGRWQDAGDLAAELQWVGEQAGSAPVSAPAVKPRGRMAAWVASLFLVAGAAAGAAWVLKPAAPAAVSAHLTIDLPPGAMFDRFTRPVLALSPDGRVLVFAVQLKGQRYLFRRTLDRPDAEVLTETGSVPFFSPDGRWVGFQGTGALRRIAVGGGAPITIASADAVTGAVWGADDQIVFASSTRIPLSRVPASGGEPLQITTFDSARGESGHRFPELLPGGRVVIFTAGPPLDGPWHEADIVAQSLDTGHRHTLIRGAAQARYVAPGYLVYARAGTLYASPFDAKSVSVTGPPVAVLDNVREDPAHGASQFAVAENGTLVYVSGGLETTEVVLVDRQGRSTPLLSHERRFFNNPRYSPNGRRLAVTVGGGNDAIFVHDLEHGGLSRVTDNTNHINAVWTPDGTRVTTQKTVTGELVSSTVDERAPETVLYRHADPAQPPSPGAWSRDGRVLAFGLGGDIWTLTLPELRAQPLIDSRFTESAPAISPDGSWLAYVSNESGPQEVYVQESRTGGQRWRVSTAGGTEPVWAGDSRRLYFRDRSSLLEVAARPPFSGTVRLFEAPWALMSPGGRPEYDVSPDGERFVMIRPPDRSTARIHVILNWVDELKRRVPR